MLVSAADPTLFLFQARDVEDESLPGDLARYKTQVRKVTEWARAYLTRPHAALGRDGPVCPYTEPSLQRSLFWLTVYSGSDPSVEDVSPTIGRYGDWFQQLDPVTGKDAEYKAILVLFPELQPARVSLIDEVQRSLKPRFTRRGLMLGQFHERCDEPALWNPSFKPLRCRVPLLAIRSMVRTDAPFLMRDAASLSAYLQWFGSDMPVRLRGAVREAALGFGLEVPEE